MMLLLSASDDEVGGITYGRNYGEQTEEHWAPGFLALSGQIKQNGADREQKRIV